MRLLLPKPRSDWSRWQRELSAINVDSICIDPWAFEWLPETPEQRTTWLNLDEFQGVICVSARAAEGLVHALDRYWPMPPAGVHWMCNGSGTAAVLTQADLPVVYPSAENTAEAVLALPETQAVADKKWLIVKGEGGRDTFTSTLTARGAEVTEMVLYRRSVPDSALNALLNESAQADAILISSETLANALWDHAPEHWRLWPGDWWFSSSRLLDWAKGRGITRCTNTGGAALEAVSRTLVRERQRHGR